MTWFVHHDEKILGPFSTEKILRSLKDGDISYGAYIWSKGQVEWVPVSEWENNLESILSHSDQSKKKWKIRTPKETLSEMPFDDVVQELKCMGSLKMVTVSQSHEENWVPVYSSFAFMEALNLSRRHFLRAPLMGLAKVTKDASRFSYVVKTATIGQGGIGVYGLGPNFDVGTQVTLKVESEDLNASISVNGIVVYNTNQGFIGIRFGALPAESISVIVDYMNRFQGESESVTKKVA